MNPVGSTGSVLSRVQLVSRCGAHLKGSPQGDKPFFQFQGDKNWRLGEMIVGQSTPVLLVGLITPFTLMAKLSQGSSQLAGIAQLIRAPDFQSGGCGFESHCLLQLVSRYALAKANDEVSAGRTRLILPKKLKIEQVLHRTD